MPSCDRPSLGRVPLGDRQELVNPLPELGEHGPERGQALLLGALDLRGIRVAPVERLVDAGEDGHAPRASSHTVIT